MFRVVRGWALFYIGHIQNLFAGRTRKRVPGFSFRAAGSIG
jgi:hypothetical protein